MPGHSKSTPLFPATDFSLSSFLWLSLELFACVFTDFFP